MNVYDVILSIIFVVIVVGIGIYVNGFKNWLVWAVSEAEAVFGSNTGKLKLRYAYELAIKRFPIVAKFIPFKLFGKFVDSALDIMRNMIENNKDIANAIKDEISGCDEITEVVE
jgi:hypothetical protein